MRSMVTKLLARTTVVLAMVVPVASQAAVVYRFSLEANGGVGPIVVRQTAVAFIPPGNLIVTDIADPTVSFTSGTAVDSGLIGFDQDASETLYGVALFGAQGAIVLLNDVYPDDFFRFARTFDQEGTFASTRGLVQGDLNLATATPVATLCVSSTGACDQAVPEPGTIALLGLGLAGFAAASRRKQ